VQQYASRDAKVRLRGAAGRCVYMCVHMCVDRQKLYTNAWAAHSEHQEVWAGPSWSSIALKVRSLLLPGVQDPSKSVLLHAGV
jgi:hypothetical protein